jgi:predicted small integral membrane protein
MWKLVTFTLLYSALIEVESAFFKGAVATLLYRPLSWWAWGLTAAAIFGFGVTLSVLIKRLERLRSPENVRNTGSHRADERRTVAITAAVLVVLLCSALVHLDDLGRWGAERHAGLAPPPLPR